MAVPVYIRDNPNPNHFLGIILQGCVVVAEPDATEACYWISGRTVLDVLNGTLTSPHGFNRAYKRIGPVNPFDRFRLPATACMPMTRTT